MRNGLIDNFICFYFVLVLFKYQNTFVTLKDHMIFKFDKGYSCIVV